jgi:hypothetical protein
VDDLPDTEVGTALLGSSLRVHPEIQFRGLTELHVEYEPKE